MASWINVNRRHLEVEAVGYPGAVAAGGRYDQLVATLGGPDVPAVGGSVGIERILAMQETTAADEQGLDVAITVLDGGASELMRLGHELRGRGLRVGTYLGTSNKLGKQLKWANDQRARLTVIRGAEERGTCEVTVRDMTSGEQERVSAPEAVAADRGCAVGPSRAPTTAGSTSATSLPRPKAPTPGAAGPT